MPEDEAAELAAMIQASIDSVDVEELTEVLDEPDDPPPLEHEGIVEPEIVDSNPVELTIDEGTGSAIIDLEARIAELHSHIREFLLISREHDANDVTAFVEDLGEQGFQVGHAVVRNRVMDEITEMANRRDAETEASSQIPVHGGMKALRRLEECRPSLLDSLEAILDADEVISPWPGSDLRLAAEAGLDLACQASVEECMDCLTCNSAWEAGKIPTP